MPELRLATAAAAALLACCCAQVLHREAYVSVPTLISEAGYPVERHRARTADGYHLQLHRIPAGRRVPAGARAPRAPPSAGKSKRAVLLVHGLFGSSSDFVIMGPRRSLAYLLADAGYDVWLGNLRGTTYSSHDNLTRHHPRFWDYSFAEHGEYDLPALVDAVLERTARTQLLYVGYSMGTTSLFVMLSKQPHYNDKLLAFLGLAPAVYLDGLRPLARLVLSSARMPERMRARGVHSLSLRREVLETVAGGVCRVRRAQDDVCMRLLYSVVGEDYEQNDWDMMPVVLARLQPGSLRQVEHFGKVAITGDFVEWGRGLEDQGAAAYNLSCTRVPVHLVYGENDRLTEKSQTVRLVRELRGARGARAAPVRWSKFNHLDFMFAKNLDKLLTHELVRLVNRLYKQHAT